MRAILLNMNAAEYKMACQQPATFSRFIIEETARLLTTDSKLKARLEAISTQEPIQKPTLHNGERNADYFPVNLSQAEAAEIIDILLSAEAEAVSPDGETTPYASFIVRLVDVWSAYLDFKSD
jgi:hypothetical protein